MPKLIVTVPLETYDAVRGQCGEAFADSYLSGAVVAEGRLIPRTQIAWKRLMENRGAMAALRSMKTALVKPPLYDGANDRLPQGRAA